MTAIVERFACNAAETPLELIDGNRAYLFDICFVALRRTHASPRKVSSPIQGVFLPPRPPSWLKGTIERFATSLPRAFWPYSPPDPPDKKIVVRS